MSSSVYLYSSSFPSVGLVTGLTLVVIQPQYFPEKVRNHQFMERFKEEITHIAAHAAPIAAALYSEPDYVALVHSNLK